MRDPWTTDLLRRLRLRPADDRQLRTTASEAAAAYAPREASEADEPETWLEMRRQFAAWG